jgi:hypothetical protein
MARPTQEEIDEFNRRMDEPDEDDDFEIEISTPDGHAARLPYKRGRSYLQQHFGIDLDPEPNVATATTGTAKTGRNKNNAQAPRGSNSSVAADGEDLESQQTDNRVSGRYFGRR